MVTTEEVGLFLLLVRRLEWSQTEGLSQRESSIRTVTDDVGSCDGTIDCPPHKNLTQDKGWDLSTLLVYGNRYKYYCQAASVSHNSYVYLIQLLYCYLISTRYKISLFSIREIKAQDFEKVILQGDRFFRYHTPVFTG